MRIRVLVLVACSLFSICSFATTYSKYEGKIKSIYAHERDNDPYFGVVLEGQMDNNPCGTNLSHFVKKPDEVTEMQMSMLLAAKVSGSKVKIWNAQPTDAKKCYGSYSTFNFVEIL